MHLGGPRFREPKRQENRIGWELLVEGGSYVEATRPRARAARILPEHGGSGVGGGYGARVGCGGCDTFDGINTRVQDNSRGDLRGTRFTYNLEEKVDGWSIQEHVGAENHGWGQGGGVEFGRQLGRSFLLIAEDGYGGGLGVETLPEDHVKGHVAFSKMVGRGGGGEVGQEGGAAEVEWGCVGDVG